MVSGKTCFVSGSSGFIGGHLVKRLQSEGFFVVGADIVEPQYSKPDKFYPYDLRVKNLVAQIFFPNEFTEGYKKIDYVFNLACCMGGMTFIGDPKHSYEVMIGSTQIVANILDLCVVTEVEKVFYSSSACVYNQQLQEDVNNTGLKESMAYPAWPDLIYGWQKLCSEKMHEAAQLSHGLDVRIARFHNVYGPEGTYKGGKEKAPAAICRKVIECKPDLDNQSFDEYTDRWHGPLRSIDIIGDGEQTRSFLYIDDCIDAVRLLMESGFNHPVNIGSEEMVSINHLAELAINLSGKEIKINHVSGPQGVRGRNSDNTLLRSVINGWEPKVSLKEGIEKLYNWIKTQIDGL